MGKDGRDQEVCPARWLRPGCLIVTLNVAHRAHCCYTQLPQNATSHRARPIPKASAPNLAISGSSDSHISITSEPPNCVNEHQQIVESLIIGRITMPHDQGVIMRCIAIHRSFLSVSQGGYNELQRVTSPCRGKHSDHQHMSDFPRPASLDRMALLARGVR